MRRNVGSYLPMYSTAMGRACLASMPPAEQDFMMNAIRHTPGGRIVLKAEAVSDMVRVTVSDTGEGISSEDLPFIFDRFWRGDRSRSHAGGVGGGLGLAIARQLVSAHGGEISAESIVGQGTTFTIVLPSSEVGA